MNILAQENTSQGIAGILESAPTDEITAMFVVFVICMTVLTIAIAGFVTGTIQSIRIASIRARLVQQLAAQGMSPNEIQRLIQQSGVHSESRFAWPSRWQKAPAARPSMPGKPVASHN